MKAVAIIPARYASTRLSGKPLINILGKPMIQHVYERCKGATTIDRVLVATDDKRIFHAVEAFGGEAVMTSPAHETGTDRLAEVASNIDSELVVNVQGDEPLIKPEMIDEAVFPLLEDRSIVIGTLKSFLSDQDELASASVVKVVVDKNNNALYFSRHPIPYIGHILEKPDRPVHYKHVGLYVYKREFLLKFAAMEPSPLERLEKLEQLRALENGYKVKVITTAFNSIGVDEPQDVEKVKNAMLKMMETANGPN